jgi:hypothetical protein
MKDLSSLYADFVAAYRDEPVLFVTEVLGADPLPWQREFLMHVAKGERRISVRAGHGVGKSTACAWLLLWHMFTRMPQKSVCLAGDVRVLTKRGWKQISSIQIDDELWDGVEWVRHSGLVSKGFKQTINLEGVRLTPQHKILSGENWVTALQVAQDKNILSRVLETGSANLPSLDLSLVNEDISDKTGQLLYPAIAALQNTHLRLQTCVGRLAVCFAAGETLKLLEKRMSAIEKSFQMTFCETFTCNGLMASTEGATSKIKKGINHTVPEELNAGGMSNMVLARSKNATKLYGEKKCLNILSRSKVGIDKALSLIELIMTKDMSQEISGSYPAVKTHLIDALFGNCRKKLINFLQKTNNYEPVYDILNAGPRNRFTILSNAGPIISHNCTAPTAGQLFDALFSEVKHWAQKLPEPLRDTIEIFSDRIVQRGAPESSFISARTSSAERPEALAGIHSENVLIIVDEASAVPEPVFEAAAGSMSGHAATSVLIGNPTRNTGLFFKTHHQLSSDWQTMHVSCLDNRLVAKDFIKQIASTYGEGSNAYRVRVLGEFALKDDDSLISAELVDAAMARDVVLDSNVPIVYGVDVARFGSDRTVICKRQGNVVLSFKHWSGEDLMGTVGRIVHEAGIDKPEEICVDSIGLGGGVADRLRELGHNVRDVNVSESIALNQSAARLRDELWIAAKDWLETRAVRLPKDDDLRAELIGPTYSFTSNGKIKVEGKSEMKKRGMRSPDIADALCLTFAGQAALVGGRALKWLPGKPLQRRVAIC